VDPEQIAHCEKIIRPYIRRTPVMAIDGADIGLRPGRLSLKLELLQHSGSFKARGAFANLLARRVPAAGVVAASGGNHGAAVAYAAMVLKVPAKIFIPSVSSQANVQRIRDYGADLVIEGDRYADALAASEAGSNAQAQCRYMRSTRTRPCWDKAPSAWSSTSRRRISTRYWSRSAAAG
jgi:threonine dehydratase